MKITNKNGNLTTHFFTDVDSFMTWDGSQSGNRQSRELYQEYNGARLREDIASFKTVKNFKKDTADMVAPVVKKELTKILEAEKDALVYREAGIFCDPTLAAMDEDDCMLDFLPASVQVPVVWLAVPLSASVDAEQRLFSRRAMAMIQIMQAYQSIGVSVGLLGFDGTATSNRSRTDFQIVQIKAPEQDINENVLTNMLSSRDLTLALTLSRGLDALDVFGGRDVDLTDNVVQLANPNVDIQNLLIISSRMARELADGNTQGVAQKLLDDSCDKLIKILSTGA